MRRWRRDTGTQRGTRAQALPVGRTSPLRSLPATFKSTTRFWGRPIVSIDRPFTDPRETVGDAVVMADMLARERVVARTGRAAVRGPESARRLWRADVAVLPNAGRCADGARDTGMHGGTKAQACRTGATPCQGTKPGVEEVVGPCLRGGGPQIERIRLFLDFRGNALKSRTPWAHRPTGRRNGASIDGRGERHVHGDRRVTISRASSPGSIVWRSPGIGTAADAAWVTPSPTRSPARTGVLSTARSHPGEGSTFTVTLPA